MGESIVNLRFNSKESIQVTSPLIQHLYEGKLRQMKRAASRGSNLREMLLEFEAAAIKAKLRR